MMYDMMNADMGLMMLWMILGATLWILLLVVLIWALLTRLRRWADRSYNKHSLSERLKEEPVYEYYQS
jgi:uncharacterized membrane protein